MGETASGWAMPCQFETWVVAGAPSSAATASNVPHAEGQSMAYPGSDLAVGTPHRRDIEINAVDVAGRCAIWLQS